MSGSALVDPTAEQEEGAVRIPSGVKCIAIVARLHGLHIAAEQVTLDNHLSSAELSAEEIARCATRAGMKAKCVRLPWRGLFHLRKSLPVIVTLKSGGSMVLESFEGGDEAPAVVLHDPKADEELQAGDRPAELRGRVDGRGRAPAA